MELFSLLVVDLLPSQGPSRGLLNFVYASSVPKMPTLLFVAQICFKMLISDEIFEYFINFL